jgi:WhiB family transcriptional regulator, redox-sensing transcriptional regulator
MTEVIVPLGQVIVSPDDADELGWQDQALCAQTDPEAFFPEKGGSTREAKRVCRSCEVRAECLEYALENDERFGIWGGMSERERRRLKRQAVLRLIQPRLRSVVADIPRSPCWACSACVSLDLS